MRLLLQPRHALRVAVERCDGVAGLDQLRRLAAGRRADIEHAGTGRQLHQPGRNRRRGVLHPEPALGVTGKLIHRLVALVDAHRVGQQRPGAEQFEQRRVVGLERQIERRALEQGIGEGRNGVGAIGRASRS